MKNHKKLLSLVMAVMFCVTFLAPVLVAPAPAAAAASYSAYVTENISTVTNSISTAVMKIELADVGALGNGAKVSIHLPSDFSIQSAVYYNAVDATSAVTQDVYTCTYPAGTTTYKETNSWAAIRVSGTADKANYTGIMVEAPQTIDTAGTKNNIPPFVAYAIGTSALEIKTTAAGVVGLGRIYVRLTNLRLDTAPASADLSATFVAPDGSGFGSGTVVFGKFIAQGGGTTSMIKTVKDIPTANGTLDTIMIQESVYNALTAGNTIKIKLPSGWKWKSIGTVAGANVYTSGWGFGDRTIVGGAGCISDRELTVTIPNSYTKSEGRIYVSTPIIETSGDGTEKKGDITAAFSSGDTGFTAQDIVIARYQDYSAEVVEGTAKEVVAGQVATEVGNFNIKEGLAGSILPNRTITFTLPTGAKWDWTATNVVTKTAVSGSFNSGAASINSNRNIITYTTTNTPTSSATETKIEKGQIILSPDFVGDLKVDVAGTAGITPKTVKVATVLAPVTVKADTTPNIIIGSQKQKLGVITLTEAKKEVFGCTKDSAAATTKTVKLSLPTGSYWSDKGTITVSDGDAVIDKTTLTGDDNVLNILIKSTSTKPATIKIDGASVTPNRTVPEGDFKVSVGTTGVVDSEVATLFNVTSTASAVIAKVVTPAPTETVQSSGANGAFTIGSNVMTVNGQYRILDAAPYIKAGRTYVPVRALGDALGATTNWDAATQTVTITKADKNVVLVIGNAVAKANGADVTMDVAPEITSGRTMLPARYVAEGLGYKVEWNSAAQQVIFGI